MSENEDDSITKSAKDILREYKTPATVIQAKASKREEMLGKLTSLLSLCYDKVARSKSQTKTQQRWVTICGYLVQVAGRIVTDLEYEKMKADFENLQEKVLDAHVIRQRATINHNNNQEHPKDVPQRES